MDITTRSSFVGFLLALSALSVSSATAPNAPVDQSTVEVRLSRLSSVLRERANQLPDSALTPDQHIALGWGDGRGRDWVNGRRGGGWGDGYRGDWVNGRNWRNGWADGGSFWNR